MSNLYLIGIGPGSDEYLTFKAKKTIESSDIIIGSKRALELFEDVNAEKRVLGASNVDEMLKLAVSKAKKGKSVALLSTGDPGFSGVLKPILKLEGNMDIEVIPGISSIQACAAKLSIPWDDANIITMHGKGISNDILEMINDGKRIILLPNKNVNELAVFLLENNVDPMIKFSVCEKISYSDERILKTTLKEVLNEEFSYMCVVVIN
jgi:cobalt-precorrin-7 (C5)-methyltransferase